MSYPDQRRSLNSALARLQREMGVSLDALREVGRGTTDHVVYLLMDCSGSMEGDKFEQAQRGALEFAGDAAAKGYRVGLISFASSASVACEPARSIERLQAALEALGVEGSTRLDEGLDLAVRCLAGEQGLRAIVIVTDGQPDDRTLTRRAAERVKEAGIDILAIGTDDADWDFLKTLVTRPALATYVPRRELAQAVRQAAALLPGSGKTSEATKG